MSALLTVAAAFSFIRFPTMRLMLSLSLKMAGKRLLADWRKLSHKCLWEDAVVTQA